jgi:serine/threonine-protein kinase
MLVKHATERPRPMRERRPDVPAYLAVAIDRALAKRPEDRWSDAAEFRDALDGAIASSRARESAAPLLDARPASVAPLPMAPSAVAPPAPAPVAFPPPPPGLSRGELKHWYRAQRRLAISQQLQGRQGGFIVGNRVFPFGSYDDRPLEERVLAFRHSVFNWIGWTGVFFGINIATHGPGPWFIFPSAFILLGVLRKAGSIWSDGVGPIDAFTKGIRAKLRAQRPEAPVAAAVSPALTPEQLAGQLAPLDVLGGPHGEAVRRAAADRALIQGIISGLRAIEREMIPDIGPTVDALATRVGTLATTLHRLDTDVSGASLGSLDQRIAALQAEPDAADRDRRIQLLQRQRVSLHDLLERRRSLANDLESAGLMLQNLKLDLLKFRSSGIGSAIEDQTSATQEARALSREIGHVVQAAEDLKRL